MAPSPTQYNGTVEEVVAAEPYESREIAEAYDGDAGEIPCIQLEATDEEKGIVEKCDEHIYLGEQRTSAVEAVAESIVTSVRDVEVQGGYSTRKLDYSDQRAEFVSVTFFKEHPGVSLGITMGISARKGEVRIASLKEGCLAKDSPLRAGDKVLSCNNKDCALLNNVSVAKILNDSFGCVTLVVHNEGGVSEYVESMVCKSTAKEKVGVSFKTVGSGPLTVSSIKPGSKFSHSLLNAGDSVLSINGTACSHLDPIAAAVLIKESPQKVTILAKTLRSTGVVVAQISDRVLASPPTTNSDAYAFNPNAIGVSAKEKAIMMCVCAMFVLVGIVVATAFGVRNRDGDDDYYSGPCGNDGCDYWSENNDFYTDDLYNN